MQDEKNNIPTTPLDLLNFLKQGIPESPTKIDTSKLNYVIYARKSTKGDERQERSIPDQIRDCIEKVAKTDNLNIIGEPIEEKCSAKEPDIRPKFTKLLEDVRYGKIDGIITWHPDRLSRNMKEAGEIIDLLDKGILKDLRFATSAFENSPTGKMLLGISFVLSKQYSEHLSESVTRGNRRKTEDGYFFDEMKHGYFIKDGRLHPDGANFALIQEAFQRRMEGEPLKDIAKWLTSQDYMLRKKGKEPIKYIWNVNKISKLFQDPTYAGVLKYGESLSELGAMYDFEPAISVDEFFKINKVKDFRSAKIASSMMINKREDTKANLLRGIVHCGHCGKPFSSGLTRKVRKDGEIFYYNYKCETVDCAFSGKSVRAKHVLEYAYSFLDTHLFTSQSDYRNFIQESKEYTAKYAQDLISNIMSLTKIVGIKQREYDNAKNFIINNPTLKDHYDLDAIKSELDTLTTELTALTKRKSNLKESVVTYNEYLELFQNISVKLRKTDDMKLLDQVLRKFFSNFTVTQSGSGKQQRRDVVHTLKEPWLGLLKSEENAINSMWSG